MHQTYIRSYELTRTAFHTPSQQWPSRRAEYFSMRPQLNFSHRIRVWKLKPALEKGKIRYQIMVSSPPQEKFCQVLDHLSATILLSFNPGKAEQGQSRLPTAWCVSSTAHVALWRSEAEDVNSSVCKVPKANSYDSLFSIREWHTET